MPSKPNPWARRRARRALVQAVYQWQMSDADTSAVEREFLAEKALAKADVEFFQELLRGVLHHSDEVDVLFTPLLDREFASLDQVELAILRLGAFELKNRIDVPYRVVIDEYVQLAKLFGAEDSYKYINGVLDRLAGDIRKIERHGS
ncbi:MAG: transcription antitermination factor NusB [Gammaproteobacteria bacterium]|nr:transcription antitermination factor NusB [Gammaproteobacteria bacterium]